MEGAGVNSLARSHSRREEIEPPALLSLTPSLLTGWLGFLAEGSLPNGKSAENSPVPGGSAAGSVTAEK